MGDLMRPLPFIELLRRLDRELSAAGSVFSIAEEMFYRPRGKSRSFFGEKCSVALGPAAGPHSQLAQNIVSAYLCGARFFELKTVQILDELEIEKPCIDAGDECFNTEWSSEFTLSKAYDEYLKAWFLLHYCQWRFFKNAEDTFIFNMSVGYDLEGIKNPRVDRFIEDLKDSSAHPYFLQYSRELQDFIPGEELSVSPQICRQLTLSTMHGCPPDEIEKICRYMLQDKKLDVYVKLNPTLLGYEFIADHCRNAGFDYLEFSREAFLKDLQMADALPMLKRLLELAEDQKRFFGVKLTNTLGTKNTLGRLPGEEMYLSGRLLFPLSINLAYRLAAEFQGDLDISFSGGISAFNIEEVLACGIAPVTVATELLKPGGYLRLRQLAALAEQVEPPRGKVHLDRLKALAARALEKDYPYKNKEWRGTQPVRVKEKLPLTDCFIAPCKVACPIGQDAPEYIRLCSLGHYREALELIYRKNALPSITGHICAHQCQYNCTRRDYEGAVEIREVKRIALEKGFKSYRSQWQPPPLRSDKKALIIGAGPAGLSAAYFLARSGMAVTLMEEQSSAGGVVEYQLPGFRIPREAIRQDWEFIRDHGVDFRFNQKVDFNLKALRQQGFDYMLIAVGADRVREFPIEGNNQSMMSSHELIGRFNRDPGSLKLGRHVVVVGAGDTAMDAARTAKRVAGVEKVQLVYRRSMAQMPCTEEEFRGARAEGVEFLWLRNPERFDKEGNLHLRVMTLGDADPSGRRRPLPTETWESISCDTLIPSIGEAIDTAELNAGDLNLPADPAGALDENLQLQPGVFLIGDVQRGPSTIVNCIADGRKAAEAIARQEGLPLPGDQASGETDSLLKEIYRSKDFLPSVETAKGQLQETRGDAAGEAQRCLQCQEVCNKCVDVCPNRANLAVEVPALNQRTQILHLDACCNECGNCATFCPWEGRPYQDKITLFSRMDDFRNSINPGFFLQGEILHYRRQKESLQLPLKDVLQALPRGMQQEMHEVFLTVYRNREELFGSVDD